MTIRAIRCVGNLKYMAVADSSEVRDGLAIHRKVETSLRGKDGRASHDAHLSAMKPREDGAPDLDFYFLAASPLPSVSVTIWSGLGMENFSIAPLGQ